MDKNEKAELNMKTSTHGLTLIEQREGIRLTGYKDSKGLPTIGVGHLIKSGEPYRVGKKITQEECDRLFADDIKTYENAVNHSVKAPLSQNQFDALVSVSLNIGVQGFKNSTIVRRLNAKNYKGAADAIMFWNKPPEIKGRRRTEQKQFLTPSPIPATTAANDGNPSLPQPSNTTDQPDPVSTDTANTASADTAPDLSGSVIVPVPTQSDDAQETETNVSVSTSQTPAPELVEIKPKTPTWKTTIGAGLTAIWGYYQLAKENFGELVDRATGAIDAKIVAEVAVGLGLIGLAYWLYNQGQKRAHEQTLVLIKAAADPALNTVELK